MYHVDGEHLLVGTGSLTSNHPRPTQVPYTNTVFLAWRSMEGGRREGGGGYKRGGEGGAEEGEWEEGERDREGGQKRRGREEEKRKGRGKEEGEKGQRSINSYVTVLFNKLLTKMMSVILYPLPLHSPLSVQYGHPPSAHLRHHVGPCDPCTITSIIMYQY